jgi:hypothetical protein
MIDSCLPTLSLLIYICLCSSLSLINYQFYSIQNKVKLVKIQLLKAYLEHCMVFAMAVGGIGELKINISTT